MRTVTIGGRALNVRAQTLGMLKKEILPRSEYIKRAEMARDRAKIVDLLVEELLMYLRENEGVTADWLLDNVPADAGAVMTAVRAAADAGAKDSPGEAPRP